MTFDFTDNSKEVEKEFEAACLRALTKCGMVAESYAKNECPVDTGYLRNSITFTVKEDEKAAYIGSNTSYAVNVELGSGIYYPGGRQDPWVYQDAKGNWHMTHGQKAQPFLKPAVADHASIYQKIVEDEMKG